MVLSSSISQDKPSSSTCRPSVPSGCAGGNVLDPEHNESPDSDLPSGEDFIILNRILVARGHHTLNVSEKLQIIGLRFVISFSTLL